MMSTDTLEVRVIGEPGTDDSILQSVKAVTTTLTGEVEGLEAEGDIKNLESPLTIDQNNAFKNPWYSTDLATYAAGLGILPTDPEYQTKMEQLGMQLEIEWSNMRYGWPLVGAHLVQQSSTVDVGGITTGISVPGVVHSLTDINDIKALDIGAQAPTQLENLANVQMHPVSYMRAEGGYAGTITAKIVSSNVGAVNTDVQKMIDKLSLPSDVKEVKTGGVMEQMMEGFSQMFVAIGLAIIIVYIILLVFFRSWLTPLLIMFSLPLATIGVVVALLLSGYTLGMSAMMGVLMLVGIVLTNAIVLLKFVEDRRNEGYSTHDALMDAGRIRLRPILMTAICTIFALVPLSLGLGEGELIAAELGVVVIGGLFSSTVLTLIVIPVLYSLTERFRRKPKIKNDKPVEAL
jgi:HAE1 family hydrophobic/amphiphilic exporter-1